MSRRNQRSSYDIIQSNEVFDALDIVPLRKTNHGNIEELYIFLYQGNLIFFWDTPQEKYQPFIERFHSYMKEKPAIYQPDVFRVTREIRQRLTDRRVGIFLDYYARGITRFDRVLNLGRNVYQNGILRQPGDDLYRSEGLIPAIQALGLVDTTIRVDTYPIKVAREGMHVDIKNQ